MSLQRLFAAGLLSSGILITGTGVVLSQDYPSKPIRILTSAPGGGTDFAARIIAQGLSTGLGQPVVVENRTAILSAEAASKAPPDGYTLLVSGDNHWITPLMQNVPYDPVRDFSPVTFTGRSPLILVVHPSMPVKSLKELISLAKARPGQLNYASGGAGTLANLAAEYFKSLTGVDIVRVSYKGNGPALTGTLSGEVQMLFVAPPPAGPHLKSGKIRPLAVTSLEPYALLPGLPTMAAMGLPEYQVLSLDVVLAPAKTPVAVINRLQQEIIRNINGAEVKQKFANSGLETVGSSPEESAKYIKSDMAKWGRVIKDAGIRIE